MTSSRSTLSKTVLLAIFVLAAALRVWQLDWGLPNASRPVTHYPDDYTPIWLLSNMKPSHFDFNPHYFHNPTFFYYQIGAAIKMGQLTGFIQGGQDKSFYQRHRDAYMRLYLAGRIVVVVYSMLVLLLLYKFCLDFFGEAVALWAALIWAVAPLPIFSSKVLEVSTPLAFWSLCVLYACVKAAASQSRSWLRLAAVFWGLALSTKYLAAPLLLPLLVAHAYVERRLLSSRLLLDFLIAGVFFLLGTPYALLDFSAFRQGFLFSFGSSGLETTRGWHFGPKHLIYTFGAPLTLVSFGALFWACVKRNRAAVISASFVVPFLILLSGSTRQVARYYLDPLLFLIPFGATALAAMSGSRWPRLGKTATALIVLPSVLYSLAFCRMLSTPDTRDQMSEWVRSNIPKGATIGTISEPLWYAPGVIFTDYRRQQGTEPGIPEYRTVVADFQSSSPWGTAKPDYIIIADDEWKLKSLARHAPYQWPPEFPEYETVRSYERIPHLGRLSFPKRDYYNDEWTTSFPALRVWKLKT